MGYKYNNFTIIYNIYIIYYSNYSTLHKSPKVGTSLMWQSGKVAMWHFYHYGGTYDGFSVVVRYDFVICASLFFTIEWGC